MTRAEIAARAWVESFGASWEAQSDPESMIARFQTVLDAVDKEADR